MQQPFVIDVFTTDSKNSTRKRRISADFMDLALNVMDTYSSSYDVTRIVVSRRVGGSKNMSKMKVWTRNLAS